MAKGKSCKSLPRKLLLLALEEATDFLSEHLLEKLHLSLPPMPLIMLEYHCELDTSEPILKYCCLPRVLVCGAMMPPLQPRPEPTGLAVVGRGQPRRGGGDVSEGVIRLRAVVCTGCVVVMMIFPSCAPRSV